MKRVLDSVMHDRAVRRRLNNAAAARAARGVRAAGIAITVVVLGCIDKDDAKKMIEALQSSVVPDSLPAMQNTELPFKYPPDLYARKVQGNVTLRIHIDSVGQVRPESTTIVESSGLAALDSAAVAGARVLRFRPAMKNGLPLAISVLFPVYFRHPDAVPLPGDTVLKPRN